MINYSVDKSNLRGVIEKYHEQFIHGFEFARKTNTSGLEQHAFKSITVSGMGGSALPANILRIYLHDYYRNTPQMQRIEIFQNRFYTLPPEAYQNSLNLVCSFSGNTEETLDSMREVITHKLPAIGISVGGELEVICKQNQIPHIRLHKPFPTFQPRFSTGYFFASIIQILISLKMIPDLTSSILACTNMLPEVMPMIEKIGYNLAERIQNKTILIYSSPKFKALALAWKIKFNENSKVPAFWNFFPELNHNEMMCFNNQQNNFFVIMLKDNEDHPKNLKRYTVLEQILAENNIDFEVAEIIGDQILAKIFRTLLIGEWASYYLALINEIDPTPVKNVERFKVMLKSEVE